MPDAGQMEKRQGVLADFGEFALRSDDLDAVLTEACRLVAGALGTGRAKVLEIVDEGRTLFVRAGVGWEDGIVGRMRLAMTELSSETYSHWPSPPVRDEAITTRRWYPSVPTSAVRSRTIILSVPTVTPLTIFASPAV